MSPQGFSGGVADPLISVLFGREWKVRSLSQYQSATAGSGTLYYPSVWLDHTTVLTRTHGALLLRTIVSPGTDAFLVSPWSLVRQPFSSIRAKVHMLT